MSSPRARGVSEARGVQNSMSRDDLEYVGLERGTLEGDTVGNHNTVAAFDFDGTLTKGDSVVKFLVCLRGRARVAKSILLLFPLLILSGIDGDRYADTFKQRLFAKTIGGMTMDELLAAGERFGKMHLGSRARSTVLKRLEWHRDLGHSVVIVSASPECYIEPVARLLGAEYAIATKFSVDESGRVDGSFQGSNCRGTEKARRLREWIDQHSGSNGQVVLWAYGNSLGDKDMLSMADTGIKVGRLGRMGRLSRFSRLGSVMERVDQSRLERTRRY